MAVGAWHLLPFPAVAGAWIRAPMPPLPPPSVVLQHSCLPVAGHQSCCHRSGRGPRGRVSGWTRQKARSTCCPRRLPCLSRHHRPFLLRCHQSAVFAVPLRPNPMNWQWVATVRQLSISKGWYLMPRTFPCSCPRFRWMAPPAPLARCQACCPCC